MRAARLLPLLLWVLGAASVPAFGQGFTAMTVCNAGTVSVDAYVMLEGTLTAKTIGPADCEQMFQVAGGISPAGIGFAFTDAKGVWGPAKRLDLFPVEDMGPYNRTISVKHDAATVSMPLKAQWAPDPPTCTQPAVTTARANLPLNATTSQRIQAEQADQRAAQNSAPICYSVGLGLTVIPYPDSHELGFDARCDPCDAKKYANMTQEEKDARQRQAAAYEQTIHGLTFLPGAGRVLGKGMANMMNQAKDQVQQEADDRAEIAKGPWKMDWKTLSSFITASLALRGQKPYMANRHIVIQGTVEKVVPAKPGAERPWVNVYFKDAHQMTGPAPGLPGDYGINQVIIGPNPERAFDICTLGPDIFQEMFGADYATAMVGKTLEMEGEVNRSWCDAEASIRVTLVRQLKTVAPGTAIDARAWDVSMAPKVANRGVVTPPREHAFDAREPNYSLTSDRAINLVRTWCGQLYNGGAPVRARNDTPQGAHADHDKCVARFDGMELANHRRAAMRFCFTHYDYFTPGGDANAKIKAYDSCMFKHDTLTALCTIASLYNQAMQDKTANRTRPRQACDAPRPTAIERAVIHDGGFDEKDRAMVIPPDGPGLPETVLTAFEPNAAQRSGSDVPMPIYNPDNPTSATFAPAPAAAPGTATTSTPAQETGSANVRGAAPAPATSAATPSPAQQPAVPQPVVQQPAVQRSDGFVERVLQLLKARRPEANIMRMVQANGRPHDLSATERAQLEQAGASENLIEAIMHPTQVAGAPHAHETPAQARGDQQIKAQACQQEARIAFPNDAVAQAKALLTCMGVR